jgi:hypothetical protein
MKVSRKVARRSRRSHHSSISRRRFRSKKSRSGYKKRYAKTQKGGKRGRGQKRMGARTHKRGRRFHRGGEPIDCISFTQNNGNYIYKLTKTPKSLYVKKKGTMFQGSPTQDFNVTLSVITGRQLIQDMSTSQSSTPTQFVVTFERTTKSKDDGDDVSFSISDLGYFTDKGRQNKTKRDESTSETYDFSDTKNDVFFTEIKDCIQNQLLKQKQELNAYYEEIKDLLQNCRIVILSSMDSLRDDMVTDIKSPDALTSLVSSQTIPFFSFLLLLYYDSSAGAINKEKTIKLLELFKSLYKYVSFSCRDLNSYTRLKKLSPLIKGKVASLLRELESLLSICAADSSDFKSVVGTIKKYNKLLSEFTPPPSTEFCSTGKITDFGIKVVGLFRVSNESEINSQFLDYDSIPPNTLSTYLEELPPTDFDADEFKRNLELERPSDIQVEQGKIAKRKSEVDGVIASLGENITAHENDTTSMLSYSDFKTQLLESDAKKLKNKIIDSYEGVERLVRTDNVDFYLKKILETYLEYMRIRYRAFYIYQDFRKPADINENNYTNTESGLDEVKDLLKGLDNNVRAFRFRMEKQSEKQSENPVDGVYSDLVSTLADDSNYEKLFPE